jgi:hypothetical protein
VKPVQSSAEFKRAAFNVDIAMKKTGLVQEGSKGGAVVHDIKKRKRSSDMPDINASERKVFSEYFSLMDVNGDQSITFEELKSFMLKNDFDVTDDDINLMMSDADTDRNGTIDLDEFCVVCKRGEDLKSTKAWQQAQARLGEEIHGAIRPNKGKRQRSNDKM